MNNGSKWDVQAWKERCRGEDLCGAYRRYREAMDQAELALSKHLPCWSIEIREHRKDSFEVLLVPPLSKGGNELVFYMNAEQVQQMLSPAFHCSAENFFGFDLLQDRDFKA